MERNDLFIKKVTNNQVHRRKQTTSISQVIIPLFVIGMGTHLSYAYANSQTDTTTPVKKGFVYRTTNTKLNPFKRAATWINNKALKMTKSRISYQEMKSNKLTSKLNRINKEEEPLHTNVKNAHEKLTKHISKTQDLEEHLQGLKNNPHQDASIKKSIRETEEKLEAHKLKTQTLADHHTAAQSALAHQQAKVKLTKDNLLEKIQIAEESKKIAERAAKASKNAVALKEYNGMEAANRTIANRDKKIVELKKAAGLAAQNGESTNLKWARIKFEQGRLAANKMKRFVSYGNKETRAAKTNKLLSEGSEEIKQETEKAEQEKEERRKTQAAQAAQATQAADATEQSIQKRINSHTQEMMQHLEESNKRHDEAVKKNEDLKRELEELKKAQGNQ